MTETNEVIQNAKASWRRNEISDQDFMDICRRAGLDAALSGTAAEILVKPEQNETERN